RLQGQGIRVPRLEQLALAVEFHDGPVAAVEDPDVAFLIDIDAAALPQVHAFGKLWPVRVHRVGKRGAALQFGYLFRLRPIGGAAGIWRRRLRPEAAENRQGACDADHTCHAGTISLLHAEVKSVRGSPGCAAPGWLAKPRFS